MIKRNYMLLILNGDSHTLEYFDTEDQLEAHLQIVDDISSIEQSFVFRYDDEDDACYQVESTSSGVSSKTALTKGSGSAGSTSKGIS